jgi:hypothetical protein
MQMGQMALTMGMALWIVTLPIIALFRGKTKSREYQNDDVSAEYIARRIGLSKEHTEVAGTIRKLH